MREMIKAACVACAACVLACCGAGCRALITGEPHSETGYRFEVLKPPVLVTGPNVTAVTSTGASALVGVEHGATFGAAVEAGGVSYAAPRVRAGRAVDCTLQDVCERLDRLERAREPQAPALPRPRLPMPKGDECP